MHINKDVLTKNPPNYKCKLYETIRNNGGWSNWTMEIISFFNCQDHYEARKKEQEYFVLLNATLNSIEPMPKPKIKPIKVTEHKIKHTYYCEKCNIYCDTKKAFDIHNNTKKHNTPFIYNFSNNDVTNNPKIFNCLKCNYITSNKKDYFKHLVTNKHTNKENQCILIKNTPTLFTCICGKKYKDNSGLWRHKKICIFDKEPIDNSAKDFSLTPQMFYDLLNQNNELTKQLIELSKEKLNDLHLPKNCRLINLD